MTNTVRDNNGVPVAQGASHADGVTLTPFFVDPSTHGLEVDDDTTGSDLSGNIAQRDANNVPSVMGTSSSDGATPTVPYLNATTKKLLINSN